MSEPIRQCGNEPDANPEQQHSQPKFAPDLQRYSSPYGRGTESAALCNMHANPDGDWVGFDDVEPILRDMYEALKQADDILVAIQAFIHDNDLSDDEFDDGAILSSKANFCVTDIRAALAKAQGGAQ